MSSYRQNDRKKARRRLLIASILVALVFFGDLISGGSIRSGVRTVGARAWSLGAAVARPLFGSGYFSSKRALSAEIETLRRALADRQALDGRLELLKRENEELRALSHLAENNEGVVVPIISSSASSPYGTFLIGGGTQQGIRAGDAVLADGARGFVVGRVAEARAKSALVKELFAPGERVEGTARGAALSIEGRGGSNARAEAPASLPIAEGDVVTSPDFAGRVIGIVGSVSEQQGSGLMRVFVRAPARVTDLHFVYVARSLE